MNLANKCPIQTLIDSGISSSVYLELVNEVTKDLTLYQTDNHSSGGVKIADRKTVPDLKTLKLPIVFGSYIYFNSIHIVKDLPVPLLLGGDLLDKHKRSLTYN